MNNHLSQDEMSRCLLDQASSEQKEHGRHCPQCRAELLRFTDAVSTFQGAMKNWSEEETFPRLEEAPSPLTWRGWAVAGLAIAVLAAIPIYEHRAPQVIPEPETHSDELLMEEVAAHLSRPLPLSMERVMVLLPEVEQGNVSEREEVR